MGDADDRDPASKDNLPDFGSEAHAAAVAAGEDPFPTPAAPVDASEGAPRSWADQSDKAAEDDRRSGKRPDPSAALLRPNPKTQRTGEGQEDDGNSPPLQPQQPSPDELDKSVKLCDICSSPVPESGAVEVQVPPRGDTLQICPRCARMGNCTFCQRPGYGVFSKEVAKADGSKIGLCHFCTFREYWICLACKDVDGRGDGVITTGICEWCDPEGLAALRANRSLRAISASTAGEAGEPGQVKDEPAEPHAAAPEAEATPPLPERSPELQAQPEQASPQVKEERAEAPEASEAQADVVMTDPPQRLIRRWQPTKRSRRGMDLRRAVTALASPNRRAKPRAGRAVVAAPTTATSSRPRGSRQSPQTMTWMSTPQRRRILALPP